MTQQYVTYITKNMKYNLLIVFEFANVIIPIYRLI